MFMHVLSFAYGCLVNCDIRYIFKNHCFYNFDFVLAYSLQKEIVERKLLDFIENFPVKKKNSDRLKVRVKKRENRLIEIYLKVYKEFGFTLFSLFDKNSLVRESHIFKGHQKQKYFTKDRRIYLVFILWLFLLFF